MRSRWSVRELAVELLVVVGGILIAFSLDAWWDDREQQRWETSQLEALHEEFSANREQFQGVQRSHERAVDAVFEMLSAASRVPIGAGVTFEDSILVSLVGWRTTDVFTGALDALLASGQLSEISNAELRRLLAEWPAELANGLEDEQVARDFVVHRMAPDLAGQGLPFQSYRAHMGRTWPQVLELPPSSDIRASVQLKDLLAERLRHLRYNAASSIRLQRKIDDILELLEMELSSS